MAGGADRGVDGGIPQSTEITANPLIELAQAHQDQLIREAAVIRLLRANDFSTQPDLRHSLSQKIRDFFCRS